MGSGSGSGCLAVVAAADGGVEAVTHIAAVAAGKGDGRTVAWLPVAAGNHSLVLRLWAVV